MPNKKKQRNGFYFYMKEMQETMKNQGIRVSMEKLPALAHPKWKALTPEQQTVYNDKAKNYKENWHFTEEGKMDCFGLPVEHGLAKLSKEEQKREDMVQTVMKSINRLSNPRDLIAKNFYIIQFNVACKTDCNEYLPCEVGLVEFSITKGVRKAYHTFIDPGELPLGYKFTCREQTEAVHGIPFENFDQATKDLNEVYQTILDFVCEGGSMTWTNLYSLPEDMDQNEACLKKLGAKAEPDGEIPFIMCDILVLLEELRRRCDQPINSTMAIQFMAKTTFDYEPNVGCEYHDEIDRAKACALGIAKRQAFLMADQLCEYYQVDFIPGKHLPEATYGDFTTVKVSEPKKSGKAGRSTKEPEKPTLMPVVIKKGRSAVFEPDNVEIMGYSSAEQKEKYEGLAAAASNLTISSTKKQAQRTEPPNMYNEAVQGWMQPEFTMEDSDFPSLESTGSLRGFGRGKGIAGFGRGCIPPDTTDNPRATNKLTDKPVNKTGLSGYGRGGINSDVWNKIGLTSKTEPNQSINRPGLAGFGRGGGVSNTNAWNNTGVASKKSPEKPEKKMAFAGYGRAKKF